MCVHHRARACRPHVVSFGWSLRASDHARADVYICPGGFDRLCIQYSLKSIHQCQKARIAQSTEMKKRRLSLTQFKDSSLERSRTHYSGPISHVICVTPSAQTPSLKPTSIHMRRPARAPCPACAKTNPPGHLPYRPIDFLARCARTRPTPNPPCFF